MSKCLFLEENADAFESAYYFCGEYIPRCSAFALFTNPPLAGAASWSFQYWDRECNCWFFFISTKCNGLIFNME